MKLLVLTLLMLFSLASFAEEKQNKEAAPVGVGTDRLEGISGAVKEKKWRPFSGWFSDEGEDEKKRQAQQAAEKKKQDQQKSDNKKANVSITKSSSTGCVKRKVYITDVENPEQYKRLEDYPYTFECVTNR